MPDLVARIHAALPQTQCTRCSYPDCAAYAQAIASGQAAINHCPPGGAEGVARLSAVTGQAILPLDPQHGIEGPRSEAVIDEAWCIGCTLCLEACPTDAIVGSAKMMHTVISDYCTGCELCLPVCPVDCIQMQVLGGTMQKRTGWAAWSATEARTALQRYTARQQRLAHAANPNAPTTALTANTTADVKRKLIEAALTKARSQRKPGATKNL